MSRQCVLGFTIIRIKCLDSLSMSSRAYRTRGRSKRSEETREKIKRAVRELLTEGVFHESTVEEVADRAGVARATLYQHFRSRLELVDAICETFDQNPALLRLRTTVEGTDRDSALADTIADAMRFWASEDPVLRHLYGVVSIDPAARDLVDRQRADRRSELERLARNLARGGSLRTTERRALALLLVLTSYETFRELREAGLSDRQLTATLQETARDLLLV
jgi:AcrR family transcriptional regulator